MSAHRVLKDLFHAFTKGVGPGLVKDPGDGGTIVFDKWGQICEMTIGSGAETRTLAPPDRAGVLATVRVVTDGGGAITLTAAAGLNPSNDTTVAMADEGDRLTMISVTKSASAGTFRWCVMDGNVGSVVASTSPSTSPSSSPSTSASSSPSAT